MKRLVLILLAVVLVAMLAAGAVVSCYLNTQEPFTGVLTGVLTILAFVFFLGDFREE